MIRRRSTHYLAPSALVTAGFIVLAVCLAAGLNHYSVWGDEAASSFFVRGDFAGLVSRLLSSTQSEGSQPLYYLCLWLWTRLFGQSAVALRLPSLVCSLATIAVLWRTLRWLDVEPAVAWVGAATFLALPVIIWYSLEARAYVPTMLCTALFLPENVRTLRDNSRSCWRLALLTLLVALAYSVAGLAALLAFAVTVCRRRWEARARPAPSRPRRRWARIALTCSLMLAASVVVYWSVARSRSLAVPQPRPPLVSIAYDLYELTLGRTIGLSVTEIRDARPASLHGLAVSGGTGSLLIALGFGIALGLVVVRGMVALRLQRDRTTVMATLPWLATAAAFGLYAARRGLPVLGRHLLFALPALAVLTVLGLGYAGRRPCRIAALVVWLTGLMALVGFAFGARYAKDDYRDVARMLQACYITPANSFVVDAVPLWGFEYYGVQAQTGTLSEGLQFVHTAAGGSRVLVVNMGRLNEGPVQQYSFPTGAPSLTAAALADLAGGSSLHRLTLPGMAVLSQQSLQACVPH